MSFERPSNTETKQSLEQQLTELNEHKAKIEGKLQDLDKMLEKAKDDDPDLVGYLKPAIENQQRNLERIEAMIKECQDKMESAGN